MQKHKEPYYWTLDRILIEHSLIQEGTSTLPATQRKAVEHIYKQKLNKGLIPGQKEALTKELEECHRTALGVVRQLCKSISNQEATEQQLSNFALVLDLPTKKELANYLVAFKGNFLGWIKVTKEDNVYKGKFYVEEEKEQTGAKEISDNPEKEPIKGANNEKSNSPKGA
jgi:hypothetical protein